MDAVSAKEMATALAVFSSLIQQLGPGGLIGLFVGGPSLMCAIVFIQSAWTGRRIQIMFEESRKSINDLWERHREETGAVIKELREGLVKTTRYYEDNVKLVEDYNRLAGGLQDLVVTNIRSLEKVAAGIETLCKTVGNK